VILKGAKGRAYELGVQLGRGGEGTVYAVKGSAELAAKLYSTNRLAPTKEDPDPLRTMEEKILTMLDQPVPAYLNGVLYVAWPQDILYESDGSFAGYIMPRVFADHHIYAARRKRERVQLYPNYSWRTSVIIAYNLAVCIRMVHSSGASVGDLNSLNIMVDGKGHVTLIDTDSFNITNKKTGKTYKCRVGVAEMLAPELQGKNLAKKDSVFSQDTDNFSAPIQYACLLNDNHHPFGCGGMNGPHASSTSNPVSTNIGSGFCPWVRGDNKALPPDTLPVSMLPDDVQLLFRRTFEYTAATAVKPGTIKNRPSSSEWEAALRRLAEAPMKKCKNDPAHVYPLHVKNCPWCENSRAAFIKTSAAVISPGIHPGGSARGVTPGGTSGQPAIRSGAPFIILSILFGIGGLMPFLNDFVRGIEDNMEVSDPMKLSVMLIIISAVLSAAAMYSAFGSQYTCRTSGAAKWLGMTALAFPAAFMIYEALEIIVWIFLGTSHIAAAAGGLAGALLILCFLGSLIG